MSHSFQNLALQVGNIVFGYEIDKIVGIRLSRRLPRTLWNSARCVASDHVRNAEHDEFHQRLACRCATWVDRGIIPAHDQWRRRQCAAPALEVDSRKEIE